MTGHKFEAVNEKLLRVLVVCIGIALTIGLFLRG